LLGILIGPTMAKAQTAEVEFGVIQEALAAVDSAQQVYLESNDTYALVPRDDIGLDIRGYEIFPWGVHIVWSGASNDLDDPDWGIVLRYRNSMCWWPARIFSALPDHMDKDVRGETLACAYNTVDTIGQQRSIIEHSLTGLRYTLL